MIGVLVAIAIVAGKLAQRALSSGAGSRRNRPVLRQQDLVFVALIVGLSYLLATYKGLPNVLIIMVVLTLVYDFVARPHGRRPSVCALGGTEKAARLSA